MLTTSKIRRKKRKRLRLFIPIILIATIVLGKTYIEDSTKAVSVKAPEGKSVNIPEGSSTADISNILKENNLIKNKLVFDIHSKLTGKSSKYKAGMYDLNTDMDQEKIMNELVEGGKLRASSSFTIPEGFELKQISQRLESKGLINQEKFLSLTNKASNFSSDYEFLQDLPEESSLEGYLYPNTYEVFEDSTEEEIIRKMLDAFKKVYTSDLKKKGETLGMDTNKIMTLASIIEREAVLEKERPIMSGVFHNRLNVDMPLQSCATVQYALGERKPVLSNKDVQIKSNYNTYINAGLPPSPISSPGIESIEAAVNPENVDYLFFVRTGDDGSHTFTTTYNEHLKAKNRE